MEPEKKSLEASSTQPSDRFVFGIVLGSDLQAKTKDFKTYANETTNNPDKLSGGNSLSSTEINSACIKPATKTGFSPMPGGFSVEQSVLEGLKNVSLADNRSVKQTHVLNSRKIKKSTHRTVRPARTFTQNLQPVNTGFSTSTAQASEVWSATNTEKTLHTPSKTFGAHEAGFSSFVKIPPGTAVSFRHTCGEDSLVTRGVTKMLKTRHQCITAMWEYENKSLEELRIEDYHENRKSKQRVFGTLTAQTSGVLFAESTEKALCTLGQTVGFSDSFMKTLVGTTVSFYPPCDMDTMMKSGVTTNINTKHQCITAMKEYENKSLEELRLEDYCANMKSKRRAEASGGLFANSTVKTSQTCNQPWASDGLFASSTGKTSQTCNQPWASGVLFANNNRKTSQTVGQTYATSADGFSSSFYKTLVGTTVSFHPPSGQDTMMKSGVTTNINTKHQCITAMKEYENKSLEELRMEDYSENRRLKCKATSCG